VQILLLICVLPAIAAALAILLPTTPVIRRLVPALCWLQFALLLKEGGSLMNGSTSWLPLTSDFSLDKSSLLFVLLTTAVAGCSLGHAESFFRKEAAISPMYKPYHEKIFYSCASIFLLSMTLVFLADNLGVLWVCVEATTLSSAALVYFSRTKHALEATWKYLIICSVGIAFALLGTVLIFASSQHGGFNQGTMNIRELMAHPTLLQYPLLRLGYIFCLVGYGTKAGIFPLHSWLPDAHSEAPAPASAMLSGSLLNCALFAVWRLSQLIGATHHEVLAYFLPLVLGCVTAVAASLFLIRQHGIKRLWAYSSIENVGIMLVAVGLGSGSLLFLQAFNHSVSKVALFLLSGNIVQAAGTKELKDIRGVLSTSPLVGILLCLAAFSVTGAPPFGAFVSEWWILTQSAAQGKWFVVVALTIALALSFIAVCTHVGAILFGNPRADAVVKCPAAGTVFPALLVACAFVSGITALPSYLVTLR
jgi:hydrogenase-4 component F